MISTALVALALIAAAGFWVYERSFAQGASSLKAASNGRLDLFASVVEARVRRLEPVPATIQLNPAVLALLRAPDAARERAANERSARSKEERAVMECLIKPATLANEERSEYGQ